MVKCRTELLSRDIQMATQRLEELERNILTMKANAVGVDTAVTGNQIAEFVLPALVACLAVILATAHVGWDLA